MKVKELIKELNQLDPNKTIKLRKIGLEDIKFVGKYRVFLDETDIIDYDDGLSDYIISD